MGLPRWLRERRQEREREAEQLDEIWRAAEPDPADAYGDVPLADARLMLSSGEPQA